MKKMTHNRRSRGYTIVELILVFAIAIFVLFVLAVSCLLIILILGLIFA